MKIHFLLFTVAIVFAALFASNASAQYAFYPMAPCRVVDTRYFTGVDGAPNLEDNTRRDFQIRGLCGVPLTAKAVVLNVTVTNASTGSWVTIWPSDQTMPDVSTINFDQTTTAIANGMIVGLGTATLDLAVQNAIGKVHLIIDVNGYYQ